MKQAIDSLTNEEFEVWMKYYLKTCERYDLHMLYLCKKR